MADYVNCFRVSAQCPATSSAYGYTPSLPANAILLSAFSIIAAVQLIQGVARKTWGFMMAFMLGSLFEVIGYSARLMLHFNPWSPNGLLIQTLCLNVGPIFYCAGIYLCYSRLVEIFRPIISLTGLALYPLISVSCNILPFLLQGSGSILLTRAIQKGLDPSTGTYLIIAGLVFQIFTLLLFGILCLEFSVRAYIDRFVLDPTTERIRSTKRFQFFWVALAYAYVLIMTRYIYRVIELSGGWSSKLMKNESKFFILDGVMVFVTGCAMSLVHPGYVFEEGAVTDEQILSDEKSNPK